MYFKNDVYCPVGDHVRLGSLTKGEVCSFVCKECQFIFSWDRKGKLLPPLKMKPEPKRCHCNNCS